MPSFQVLVLGFLFVSFRPSLLRSHSCSTGACLLLSLSAFPLLLPLSFVRFFSGSDYLAFSSSFPFSSCFRLTVASTMLRFFLSASPFSTFSSAWFPMLLFRFPVLGFLFVSFHPSRFRSHSRSTGASLLFRFLSSASFPGFPLAFQFLSSPSACI